jgi:hypothetical protein
MRPLLYNHGWRIVLFAIVGAFGLINGFPNHSINNETPDKAKNGPEYKGQYHGSWKLS